MKYNLREIGEDASGYYQAHMNTYGTFTGEESHPQRKIAKHRANLEFTAQRLGRLTSIDLTQENETRRKDIELQITLAQSDLKVTQGKLNFRLGVVERGANEPIEVARQHFEDWEVEYKRLAIIEAELDGVRIDYPYLDSDVSFNLSS